MAVVSMIRVKILKRSDILFGLPILIPVLLGCNRCADDPENMNFLQISMGLFVGAMEKIQENFIYSDNSVEPWK